MWIILFNAVDDFGIKEPMNNSDYAVNYAEIEAAKRKVAEEALHGALRIAGLAGVLSSNGYLVSLAARILDVIIYLAQRLDTAVMHIILILAGHLLARLGRPEVSNCIDGLNQYSYAYEESGEQANEISRLFNRARLGELELNHMASASRVVPSPPRDPSHSPQALILDDQQSHRSNGSSHVGQPSF